MTNIAQHATRRAIAVVYFCSQIVTLPFRKPWPSSEIWDFRSFAAPFLETSVTKYYIKISPVNAGTHPLKINNVF